ncbi:ubiquitin carboxyl-terminal hydrolase-domain-containing protein [Phycomyces nitens]|nr:ubiquitin carboxyl-terminal hydrolase-domain-containing protein [Phycomyces nitens]
MYDSLEPTLGIPPILKPSLSSSDEEVTEKKKSHKKRLKIWRFFSHYHHKKHSKDPKQSTGNLLDEHIAKITALNEYAKEHLSVILEEEAFQSLLEANDWDMKKAIVDLEDYEEAAHGILRPLPKADIQLLGSENDRNTSCYIDSLLFAMYANLTTFDPLLTYDTTSDVIEKQKLQTLLRLFVNTLRKGHLIKGDSVQWLRKVLQDCAWHGQNDDGMWTQEDSSELFLFLTETFDLPFIPFQIRLFHGANTDSDDDRVMTDRLLMLSIPDGDGTNTTQLETVLINHFYNSMVTGVKRQIDYSAYAISPQSTSSYLVDVPEKKKPVEHHEEVAVTAWQVLELLPFYSATNEQGTSIKTQVENSFPDSNMILPIVLKRYHYDNYGGCTKLSTQVEIPATIPFNEFVNQNADAPVCPTCNRQIEFVMRLRSAVCHIGLSPNSGHYIGFARLGVQDDSDWLKLDDMDTNQRVRTIKGKNSAEVFRELAKNSYILFYELDKTCGHPVDPDLAAHTKLRDEKTVVGDREYFEQVTPVDNDQANSPHLHHQTSSQKVKEQRNPACNLM